MCPVEDYVGLITRKSYVLSSSRNILAYTGLILMSCVNPIGLWTILFNVLYDMFVI